ncbi:DUF3828 domain-containing protein [Enterobacteriaceae bacterium 89]|nr:DUF3828 domain-containing protein [Enterobacteriaceae bacterium 89]
MNSAGRCFFALLLALGFPFLAHAQLFSVEQTLQQIYKPYTENSNPPPFDATGAAAIVSARMASALHTDSSLTAPGDSGALDWDPRCGCQDFDHLVVENIAVSSQTENRATALVSVRPMQSSDTVSTMEYRLVKERDRWLIDDIIENNQSTWQVLTDSNQAQQKKLADLQRPQAAAFVREIYTSREFDALSWPLLLTPSSLRVMEDFHILTWQMSEKEQERKKIPDIWGTTPLCGCTDPSTLTLESVKAEPEVAGKTLVKVHFRKSDGLADSREILLRQTHNKWQIDDIIDSKEGSLMQQLERVLRAEAVKP